MRRKSRDFLIGAVTLAAMCIPVAISAQTTINVRGGLSRATLSSTSVVESMLSARMGLALGASATIPIQGNFGLRLDGGYVQKGASINKELFEIDDAEAGVHIDYIEFSGLGSVSLTPSGSPAGAELFLGPSFALKTGCEISASIDQESFSDSCGEDIRGIDLGITAGVGMKVGIQEQIKLTLELRYTMGLLSADTADDADDLKNQNLVLSAGIGFPVGQ